MPKRKRVEKFVKVSPGDNWHANHPGNTFQVSLHSDYHDKHRVACWGNDDYGLEKEFSSRGAARDCYESIGDFTSEKALKLQGFCQA